MSMSTIIPAWPGEETAGRIDTSNCSSADKLTQRLAVEVATATKRIYALQTEAARVFLSQEQRFIRFVALAKRIDVILRTRIETFTNVSVFKNTSQNVSLELRGLEERGFHGKTTTLSVPSSDACSAKVELSFHLSHDGPIENAIIDFRLAIIPVFIKFDRQDQLVIQIDNPNEHAVAEWIDDRLVGFTRTYFEMCFTEQYQQQSFETDPVMNIRFPRAFAAGKTEYQGRTCHFYTKESLQAFEKAPADYLGPRVVTTAVCAAESDPQRGEESPHHATVSAVRE
jgi:YHS domain-containing protein